MDEKEKAKFKLYDELERAYGNADFLSVIADHVAEKNKQSGWFDQNADDVPMTLRQKVAATGTWLCNASSYGVIGLVAGAALTSESMGTCGLAGLAIGGLVAKDTREKRLALSFMKHAALIATVPAINAVSGFIRARAQRKDPCFSFDDDNGQTIFTPDTFIPSLNPKDVTPKP